MKIIVASDLSNRSEHAVRRAFAIAKQQGGELIVLHALDQDLPNALSTLLHENTLFILERFCRSLAQDVRYRIEMREGDPTAELLRAGADADLMIMGVHRPRPFLDALRETTMSRVVRLLETPVLLVTGQNEQPYQNVLAACDFSNAAKAAVEAANQLAPQARLTPLHALHLPYPGLLEAEDDLERTYRQEADALGAEWAASVEVPQEKLAPLRIQIGEPLRIINNIVKTEAVDLIAIGAHGRVGARAGLLGSLASDLVRRPPCDVLISR